MLYIISLLVILGVLLLLLSSRQRHKAGLPAGRVIYSDHKQWGKIETALYDPTFNLTGKPDFILETNKGFVPVEPKSGRGRQIPFDSHIFQLAAYCLLIDKTLKTRPEYGILHYPDQDFAVDYTPDLEKKLIELIREIHSLSRRRSINRSHREQKRCQNCGYRNICDQALLI
jgi:CRISPR-associated exonuclease Cas4